ncbi:MAG: carboxypeptidase-like regulatory domain-containing protein [Bacteroidota bacterium]
MLPLSAQLEQSVTLRGKVIDPSEDPIIYALVRIDSLELRATSDLNEEFMLNGVTVGIHQLSAQMREFQKMSITVDVRQGSFPGINFTLQEETQSLETVVINVESEKEPKENLAEAVNVIKTKEAKLQSADLEEVIANTEGISVQRAGGLGTSNIFSINGILSDEIRFFFDHISLNFPPCTFGLVGANDFGSFQNLWSAKGDRLPNTSYFFSNAGAEYKLESVARKQDRISFFWNVRYVHGFFVGWESAGLQQFKAEVSNQTAHAAGLTYRLKTGGITNPLMIEIQNLMNAKVFDPMECKDHKEHFI